MGQRIIYKNVEICVYRLLPEYWRAHRNSVASGCRDEDKLPAAQQAAPDNTEMNLERHRERQFAADQRC